jgi:hypothetical protein
MDRGSGTQINNVHHRKVVWGSTRSAGRYAEGSEQQVGALGYDEGLQAGRATVGVGHTVGSKGTAAWPLQQRPPTMANPKVPKGWTEVRGHGSTTYATGSISEVQLSQWVDTWEIRSSRWECVVAMNVCKSIPRAGRASVGVEYPTDVGII